MGYYQMACKDFIFSSGNFLPEIIYDKAPARKKNIKFHIESDDYFGTLATVMDLILQKKGEMEAGQNKILKNLRNDLIFLQENYKIIRKNKHRLKKVGDMKIKK